MTDSVSRLKDLLFDRETATLSDLSNRIGQVGEADRKSAVDLAERLQRLEQTTQADRVLLDQSRTELATRITGLDARVGTRETLQTSVAEVLDDAINEARETKQDDLSNAVAPLIVKTIKTELRNNQDEMVEALYPITGRLVKQYVATAMKDMMRQMNRRMELNPAMLRFRSLVSGYSMAELALADTQRLEIEELYLIRRGSGGLVQRWPAGTTMSNSEIHMSGVLAAINDFAAHAFQDDGGNLRSFDVDDFTVFLRASPVYLLAAKCRGTALTGVEDELDGAFLDAISRNLSHAKAHQGEHTGDQDTVPIDLLLGLKNRLDDGIAARHEVIARAGLPFNPLKALAAVVALAILAGAGWYGWTSYEVHRTHTAARQVIDQTSALQGFPVLLDVGYRGRTLTVSGLAPSDDARLTLLESLKTRLAEVDVRQRSFGIIPPPVTGPDVTPQIAAVRRDLGGLTATVKRDITGLQTSLQQDITGLQTTVRKDIGDLETDVVRAAIRRSLDRAERRLQQALPDLQRLSALDDTTRRQTAQRAASEVRSAITAIAAERERLLGLDRAQLRQPAAARPLDARTEDLHAIASRLSALLSGNAAPNSLQTRFSQPTDDPAAATENVGLAAERLATTAAAAAQASAIQIPPPTPLREPTPRERIEAFSRGNAVFFGELDQFRDPELAKLTLDQLAGLLRGNDLAVRIVGYTDERGGTARNSEVAQKRAQKVADEMTARAIPSARLVLVGRATGPDLSASIGPQSPNRRVQFELVFEGEMARRQ